jgi:RNA-directed DNA polymerase
MSALKKLHDAKTIADVAGILGFHAKKLAYILYVQPDSHKYKEFGIPKKSGGVRRIAAPQGGLKLLQRRLADLLQDCLDEINKNAAGDSQAKPLGQISHGFKRGLSIRTNARKHRNRRYVFNIDLIDFFGSINFGRVRGFFIKDERFHLNPKVATIFAQIACFKQSLPQGSPCSPIVSNLIGNILDTHLVKLAARTGCIYTRYADDLTFSTNKLCFPRSIAIQSDDDNHVWMPGSELLRLVTYSGFAINQKKTRMQYRCSRQEVTGLVVNKKVNIRREYRHNTRAMAHRLFKKGSFLLPTSEKDANGNYSLETKPGSINQLHGRLGFIDGIDRYNIEILSTAKESQLKSKETIY